MSEFQTRRRVEFRDTDAARIVHFSVFFAYMEQAEHEMLRSLGLSVVQKADGQTISWPRVNAQCDYRSAIRFEDEIDIFISIERIGEKSVTYVHRFEREGRWLPKEESRPSVAESNTMFAPSRYRFRSRSLRSFARF